jgi:predicted Zn-dependent peptidase
MTGAMRSRARRVVALLICGGLAAALAAAQERPDRDAVPGLGAAPKLDLPAIQKRTLSNGLAVWLVESHEVPLVQVNLVVLAGAGDDPAGKFGAGSLTAAMLDEGAGARNALEIADAVDVLGANLSTGGSFDASAVRLNVPVARLDEALPIMADVALRPTFPQNELDRLSQEWITALLQARDDPASVAPMSFSRLVFGGTHRYGVGTNGTASTLKSMGADDLRAFHARWYQPAHATLVAVGDFEVDAMVQRLERHFGGWTSRATAARTAVPAAAQVRERQISIIDVPQAAQSQIRIGWVGVARSTPDYFTLQVLNTILGGSFTSRLNQNLREEHGYSYGASSRFEMRLSPGAFVAGAGVQTDKTAEALREFFNELTEIAAPVMPEELEKAKNYIALGLPSEFETIEDLSGHIEDLIVYELPDDYFERYVARIQAVTAQDVARAAATYIRPERFSVVVVGDRRAIEPGIRALNLGPVRTMTVAEVLEP